MNKNKNKFSIELSIFRDQRFPLVDFSGFHQVFFFHANAAVTMGK